MGFLKNLFKKKPGGTFLGNLVRGVAGMVPVIGGTVIGTGANKIEVGQTMTNKELMEAANNPQIKTVVPTEIFAPDPTLQSTTTAITSTGSGFLDTVKSIFNPSVNVGVAKPSPVAMIVGGIVAILGLLGIIKLAKSTFGKPSYKK